MAFYKDYFGIRPDYAPCMTLADINKAPETWLGFYPHDSFVEILRELLKNLEGGNKTLWITGAYGTGKSHASLVLQKLFTDDEARVLKWLALCNAQIPEPVCKGLVAAGYAISESVNDMTAMAEKLSAFVQSTICGIRAKISSIFINGDENNHLPGIVNIVFDGVTGESLMHLLDLKGICVSTSSACTSGKDKPSHVLMALGLTENHAKSAIRISYGRYNNINEVETIVATICNAYNKILAAKL